MRKAVAAGGLAAVLACTGCGGHRAPASSRPGWRAAAVEVLRQLQSDVAAAQVGGTTRAGAAKALRSFSDLYALSFAFADFGGCRAMVATAGAPRAVEVELARPCVHLERAAALFTSATSRSQPGDLVRATREVQRAEPALVQALARFAR